MGDPPAPQCAGHKVKVTGGAPQARSPCEPWGWAWSSQGRNEFFGGYVSLTENTRKRSDFDFAMHRNYTTLSTTPHDDMTAGLANFHEGQAFERSDDG